MSSSSRTTNNLPPTPGTWRSGNDTAVLVPSSYIWSMPSAVPRTYPRIFHEEEMSNPINRHSSVGEISGRNSDVHVPHNNYNHNWNRFPHAPRPLPFTPHENSGRTQDRWRLFEDRVRTGPYGLNRFPSHPFSPMRIVVLGNENMPEVNPRLRQFIQESPPRIRGQWNTEPASGEEESRLTRDEQKNALNTLKKQVYNPYPRNKNTSSGLYYRGNGSFNRRNEEQEDEGKSCAICLEDFVPKQEVLVTPCNHMFHDDCINPWVKSNGQCPVCRFTIGERNGATALALNNNGVPTVDARRQRASELIALIRAMEEAFEWVHVPQ